MARHLDRHVELEARTANVAHACGADLGEADVDIGRVRKLEPIGAELVGSARRASTGEQGFGVRSHQREHGARRAYVGQNRRFVDARVPGDPVGVAGRLRGAGNEQEAFDAEPRDREVALEATALVEHRRIDHAPGRHIDRVGAQPLEHRERVAALQKQLAERGLVVDRDRFSRGLLLGDHIGQPVRPFERVRIDHLQVVRGHGPRCGG